MRIQEHVVLKPYTTFRMGGVASFFADLATPGDVIAYARFAEEKNLPLVIIGGGSNLIFPDQGELHACVGHMEIKGFTVISETKDAIEIKIGAGEEWDSVVRRSVTLGLSGIEALSAIPGSAGGTPVQNVGAYGQEIADTLASVEVFDVYEKTVQQLSNVECKFSYRDSMFKHEGKGRYVILSITLTLSKNAPKMPAYAGVEMYFKDKKITNPTLEEIREAVIEIRRHKLPDPKTIASCGSFFKNPIVSKETAERIKNQYPTAVIYPVSLTESKVGAGWMIDTLGLKGKDFGSLALYTHNALVLVNLGGATKEEVKKVVKQVTDEVEKAFGVHLETEPVFVS